jgi:hypothetical protein
LIAAVSSLTGFSLLASFAALMPTVGAATMVTALLVLAFSASILLRRTSAARMDAARFGPGAF